MSESNQEISYEADKCQQEQSPASFAFDKHGSDDDEEHEKLLSSNEQNGTEETIEQTPVVELLNDNQVNQPKTLSIDKSLRKKFHMISHYQDTHVIPIIGMQFRK